MGGRGRAVRDGPGRGHRAALSGASGRARLRSETRKHRSDMRHALRTLFIASLAAGAAPALVSCDLLAPTGDFNVTARVMSPSDPRCSLSTAHLAYVVDRKTITLQPRREQLCAG